MDFFPSHALFDPLQVNDLSNIPLSGYRRDETRRWLDVLQTPRMFPFGRLTLNR